MFPKIKRPKLSTPSARIKAFFGFCGALAVGMGIGWWHVSPLAEVGGSRPDNFHARWVKNRAYGEVDPLDEQGFTRLTPDNAGGWYAVFREPLQTFAAYQSENPPRPTARRRTLVLQPIGPMTRAEKAVVSELADYCTAFFQLPVRVEPSLSLDLAKNWARPKTGPARGRSIGIGQYDAGSLLGHVLSPRLPDDAVAYMGITMADLYSENLAFVFGVGSVGARTGVYSLCRYGPEFWGRKPKAGDETLMLRRSCLVLNHEIGHMIGIYHCTFYKCSMNGSNSLIDADNTPLDYCPICHRKLIWDLGCDGTKRYTDLLAFYRKHGLTTEANWTQGRLGRWKQLQARHYHAD